MVRDHLPTFQKVDAQLVIVIDPGHGGWDPGKVGINNALEKDINLDIGHRLKKYFETQGIEVRITRDADKGLHSDTASNKKRSDLQNRVKIANESNPELVISIHQNSYPTPDCKGAQVFYYEGSKQGEKLAEYIQQSLILQVDKENKRAIKSNNNYFLLKEITAPTVIVECGFLSNPKEADLLISEEHQDKIALAILMGTLTFLENEKGQKLEHLEQLEQIKPIEPLNKIEQIEPIG